MYFYHRQKRLDGSGGCRIPRIVALFSRLLLFISNLCVPFISEKKRLDRSGG
jgi:hypothetical protein